MRIFSLKYFSSLFRKMILALPICPIYIQRTGSKFPPGSTFREISPASCPSFRSPESCLEVRGPWSCLSVLGPIFPVCPWKIVPSICWLRWYSRRHEKWFHHWHHWHHWNGYADLQHQMRNNSMTNYAGNANFRDYMQNSFITNYADSVD